MDTKTAIAGTKISRKRDGDFEIVTIRLPAFGTPTEFEITGEQAENAIEHYVLILTADFLHRVYSDSSLAQRVAGFAQQALTKLKGQVEGHG